MQFPLETLLQSLRVNVTIVPSMLRIAPIHRRVRWRENGGESTQRSLRESQLDEEDRGAERSPGEGGSLNRLAVDPLSPEYGE